MLYSPMYNFDSELEMMWLNHDKAVAVGCMLWLYWFYASGRSMQNISPPSDLGRHVAMEAPTVWMHNVYLNDKTADFSVDFDHCCNACTATALETKAAIDVEEQRVDDMLEDHNNNPNKRSMNDVVRKGMFDNMLEYFKGSESRFAQTVGRRTKHHREIMHTAANLCVTHDFWWRAACAVQPLRSLESRRRCSLKEPTCA